MSGVSRVNVQSENHCKALVSSGIKRYISYILQAMQQDNLDGIMAKLKGRQLLWYRTISPIGLVGLLID